MTNFSGNDPAHPTQPNIARSPSWSTKRCCAAVLLNERAMQSQNSSVALRFCCYKSFLCSRGARLILG
jgi:hypothetical protein